MQFVHSFKVNCRLLSVQAGLIGGAITAALGAYQAFAAVNPGVADPPGWIVTVAGAATAAGVFFGRLTPQPEVKSDGRG
mgnify:CR=1 FL=1